MTTFSSKKTSGGWEIWEHIEGSKRQMCVMTADDILHLFNETVPRVIEEPYMVGDVDCKHSWRPWKFNDDFIQCANCPAMRKVKKLLPVEYRNG